jgi:cytidyltransferase-like protein
VIVTFEDLPRFRGKVSMVDGGFDPLHPGHVRYFREAKERLGAPLLCNVSSDTYVAGKHKPLLNQAERVELIDALTMVDFVHPSTRTTEDVLEQLRPLAYVKGIDWKDRLPPRQIEICRDHGIRVEYTDTVTNSSSKILRDAMESKPIKQQVADFEEFVHRQATTSAADYDDSYFHDQWRAGSNDYTIETRRRIEGRNPAIIKETFQPKKVLDMGCGPGALMYLLYELGVAVDGVDFAESSKSLAPKEVAGNITIGSVTDAPLPANSYDLVICREVFEHLSVLQVQQAVANFCRITSRFVYVTTRFHPNPETLFDVTTEFDVDPTHINLMNMEMTRLLFVLQGMKRREDLERQMDWLNKGRVLVYEKV